MKTERIQDVKITRIEVFTPVRIVVFQIMTQCSPAGDNFYPEDGSDRFF
jgi:hypothetical protein